MDWKRRKRIKRKGVNQKPSRIDVFKTTICNLTKEKSHTVEDWSVIRENEKQVSESVRGSACPSLWSNRRQMNLVAL